MSETLVDKALGYIKNHPGLTYSEMEDPLIGKNPPETVQRKLQGAFKSIGWKHRHVVFKDDRGRWFPVEAEQPQNPPVPSPVDEEELSQAIDSLALCGLKLRSRTRGSLPPAFARLPGKLRIQTKYVEFPAGLAWVSNQPDPNSGTWHSVHQMSGTNLYLSDAPPEFPAIPYRNRFIKIAIPVKPGSLEAEIVVRELPEDWNIFVGAL